MSGHAAADAILATRPDARIVFVTVQDDRAVITRALDCGALGYVVKCNAGDAVAGAVAVRTALQGAHYMSSAARLALERPGRSAHEDPGDLRSLARQEAPAGAAPQAGGDRRGSPPAGRVIDHFTLVCFDSIRVVQLPSAPWTSITNE